MIASILGSGNRYPNNNIALLIIITGESNSGGLAHNADATSGELAIQTNAKILNNTTLLFEDLHIGVNNNIGHSLITNGSSHGFELEIANRVNLLPFYRNKPIYIVKTGQGGSKISEWADGSGNWTLFQTRVNAAIAALTGRKIQSIILYSQGINDAQGGTGVQTWKTATIAHFAKIRNFLGARVPIIMTRFMANYSIYNSVIESELSILDKVYSVNTLDATVTPESPNHWDYAGMKLITGRMLLLLESRFQ